MFYSKYLYGKVMEACGNFDLLYLNNEEIHFLRCQEIFFMRYEDLYLVNLQQLRTLFCH